MSAAGDIGKALLDAFAPAVAKGLVDVLRTAKDSHDPAAVTNAALAAATKAASRASAAALMATKRAAKSKLRK